MVARTGFLRITGLLVVVAFVSFIALSGCTVGSKQDNKNDQKPVVNVTAPAASPDRTGEVEQRIDASANNTQNALSGLLNASVSKMDSVVKGIESKIDATANFLNNLKLRFDTQLDVNNEMKVEMKNMMTAVADLKVSIATQLQMINDMKVQLGNINTNIQASANAQMGLSNTIQHVTTTMNAGRDVNMVPVEMVNIIKINAYITISLISLIGSIIVIIFRSIARNERDERRKMYALLTSVLATAPAEHKREIEKVLGEAKP